MKAKKSFCPSDLEICMRVMFEAWMGTAKCDLCCELTSVKIIKSCLLQKAFGKSELSTKANAMSGKGGKGRLQMLKREQNESMNARK